MFIVPAKDCKFGLGCKNKKHDAIQSAIKFSFLEWISNPGATYQKKCNPDFKSCNRNPDDACRQHA